MTLFSVINFILLYKSKVGVLVEIVSKLIYYDLNKSFFFVFTLLNPGKPVQNFDLETTVTI